MDIVERRENKRFLLAEPVRLQMSDPSKFYGCLAKNVSRSGIQLTIHEFLPLNSSVALTIQLSPQRAVERQGQIVWMDQLAHMDRYLCGIRFDDHLS